MPKYSAIVPFIPSMGSIDPITVSDKYGETKEQEVLWHLNKMREHDGQKPFTIERVRGLEIKYQEIHES